MGQLPVSNNRRIAKNTIMLYLRMLLGMFVGLYTSRVVLQTLGVEDYGIYGVIGGVVTMMSFLNASLGGASSRFLTFELGRGNIERLKKTFSSVLLIHIGIAFLIVLLAETFGLWFIYHKLVIPAERFHAAIWVFHLSVITTAVGIIQTPYAACIMSHEKMDVYAYLELLFVLLKLLIVYLLVLTNKDKLISYASLTFIVTMILQFLYWSYSIKKFPETHFDWIFDRSYLTPILKFSLNTVYANFSFTIREEGNNFVLNMLFGVAVNAASGIAVTINGLVNGFAGNIIAAFRPQIIKNYAQGNLKAANSQILQCAKYSTLLLAAVILPLEFKMGYMLNLWLGDVPQYAVSFARLTLLALFMNVTAPLLIGLNATGKIKRYSLIQGTLYILVPCFSFLTCKFFSSPEFAYLANLLALAISGVVLLLEYKRVVPQFCVKDYIRILTFNVVPCLALDALILWNINSWMNEGFTALIVVSFVSTLIIIIFTYITLSDREKQTVINYLNKIKRI